MEYGCNQCGPCRINRRRVWTTRLMLELLASGGIGHFVTLTFDDEHVPLELSPDDVKNYMKRLRRHVEPAKVRFYGVGEYGDTSGRPHYHLLVFGVPGAFAYGKHEKCECSFCKAWQGRGMLFVGTVTPQSCAYVVSYISKGMTRRNDKRLDGKHPEFARMSNGGGRSKQGGLGKPGVPAVLDGMTSKGGAAYVARVGDIPGRLRNDGKMWPLGRYLLRMLRTEYGMDVGGSSEGLRKRALELVNELSIKGARDLREQKRLQASRRAKVLNQIYRSKKGVGV